MIAFTIFFVCAYEYNLNEQVQTSVVFLIGEDEIRNVNIIPLMLSLYSIFSLSLFFLHRPRGKMLSVEYYQIVNYRHKKLAVGNMH